MSVLENYYNEVEATFLVTLRESRRVAGKKEQNKEYKKFSDASTALAGQMAQCEDRRAVVLCIVNDPLLREVAIRRAKELDLDLSDLWDILHTDNLSLEDQQDFEEMFRKKSNTAEAVAWLEEFTGVDKNEVRAAVAEVLSNPMQTISQVAQIAVSGPVLFAGRLVLSRLVSPKT